MAAARSFQSSPEGVELIAKALAERQWSRDDFWKQKEVDCSRQPVVNFCSGKKRVSKKLFVGFCDLLQLDWEVVAGLKLAVDSSSSSKKATDTDAIVKEIRQQVKADIQNRCGTMRVLDMEQPIGIGAIYTNVNILKKVLGRRRSDITALMKDCDLEDFDRFTLGQIKQRRVPGLEVVERYDRLMILGKPGAGKTTFIKRLAILCNRGKFQTNRIPVFVTLKEFSEVENHPDLLEYIISQWVACGVTRDAYIRNLLRKGRALVLLDGLDEVQETDHDRVLNCVEGFTREFQNCQFVMTCRIAAREYIFQQFTEVEIADFNKKQINEFSTKWFFSKNSKRKGEAFLQRLEDDKPIRELATNPLLLTLLCLVFDEMADFPRSRAELYKEGLDVLLKKWDAKRNIERDKVYRKLSLKRKEDLLAQLAYSTFEKSEYFFKQPVVEQKIIDYVQSLPDIKEGDEATLIDGEAILRSIEAQHGLLAERAKGIYSFSHLTFQEYFTAKQISSTSVQTRKREYLKALASHVAEKRYREVFLLTVEMLPTADDLLLFMRQNINLILAADDKLQQLLQTVHRKASSVIAECEPAAIRAFYLEFNLDLNLDTNPSSEYDLDLDLDLFSELDFDRELDFDLYYALDPKYRNVNSRGRGLDRINIVPDLGLDLDLYHALDRAFNLSIEPDLNLDINTDLGLASGLAETISSQLKTEIDAMRHQLPSRKPGEGFEREQWWKQHGRAWTNMLRKIMMEHRNICHDWQFTETQQEQLEQYYDANKLLVSCLNSDCYVDKETRRYIEDTLLLPISEIEKRPFK